MVSSGRRGPAERRRLEELSICWSENFSSDGEGRALAVIGHPEGTKKFTGKRSRTRSNRNLLGPPRGKVAARDAGDHGFRISLENPTTEFTNPTGLRPHQFSLVSNERRRATTCPSRDQSVCGRSPPMLRSQVLPDDLQAC